MPRIATVLFLLTLLLAGHAWAGPGLDPVEALPNAAEEARARALFKQLRCVVCQSESLDDSEADLARDMRRLVRAQIAAGKSDEDVKSFLTQRYGEFVLLAPPSRPSTWALWFGPFALLLGVVVIVARVLTRGPAHQEPPLSAAERKALAEADSRLNKS
jgi:cytochrome c-type biogenesis protein CcmH